MFPTLVRQPASLRKAQGNKVAISKHNPVWCSSCRLSWSPVCAWNGASSCIARVSHTPRTVGVPMHPTACFLHSLLSWSPSPCCKPDIEIDCAKHQYKLVLLPAPTFSQPASGASGAKVSRLAYPLVLSGKPMVPRHKHCPNSSVAGHWYHQQLTRDTAHALHKFGPITDLPCFPCLREVGQGRGRWDRAKGSGVITLQPCHRPSAPSLLSLETASPHQQVQTQ